MKTLEKALAALNVTDYNIGACGPQAPTLKQMRAFEKETAFKLPADFCRFTCSELGGFFIEVNESQWPQIRSEADGPAWTFMNGLHVFGLGTSIPEWLDLRVNYADFLQKGLGDFLPFLRLAGTSDRYVFDSTGSIFYWRSSDDGVRQRRTFESVLAFELGNLDTRKSDYQNQLMKKKKPTPRSKKP
jgi:hypothetical protein